MIFMLVSLRSNSTEIYEVISVRALLEIVTHKKELSSYFLSLLFI